MMKSRWILRPKWGKVVWSMKSVSLIRCWRGCTGRKSLGSLKWKWGHSVVCWVKTCFTRSKKKFDVNFKVNVLSKQQLKFNSIIQFHAIFHFIYEIFLLLIPNKIIWLMRRPIEGVYIRTVIFHHHLLNMMHLLSHSSSLRMSRVRIGVNLILIGKIWEIRISMILICGHSCCSCSGEEV